MDEIITIGQSMFDELRKTNSYYVDKTEFLYELCAGKTRSQVSLFTRPRRFGKTLMMSMMENFFSITKDSRELFDGLNIMKHPEFCDEYMNKYPVIFVSYKEAFGRNFDKAYGKFTDIIAEACYNISEIVDNEKINPNTIATFRRLESKTATEGEVENSLVTLMSILYTIYNKKVILLIDEYDVPLAKAYVNNGVSYYNDMLEFTRAVLSPALKDNRYLEFAVLTGCLRISKESIFTGLNNLVVYSILDDDFSNYFGFTEDEVQVILDKLGCSDKLSMVRKWYDGYIFGKDHMYCPWDVVNYASKLASNKDALPENFWQNTSSNDIVSVFVNNISEEFQDDIEDILKGNSVTKTISEYLNYKFLTSDENNLWSTLLFTGYLTKADTNPNKELVALKIPNKEILGIFEDAVIQHFRQSVRTPLRDELLDAMWSGDASRATEIISDFLWKNISFYDCSEIYYHAFVVGLFSGLNYIIDSNKEHGLGRPDILIRDRNNKRAIILELKIASSASDKSLTTACNHAVKQIKDNMYYKSNSLSGYTNVVCYGMACFEKFAKLSLMS